MLKKLAVLVALAACGQNRLTPAEAGSQALIYVWGEGAQACGPVPAARGQAVTFIAARADEVRRALVHVDADLTVTDADGNRLSIESTEKQTWGDDGEPLGLARSYRARFPRVGKYVLTAVLEDGTSVSHELMVAEQAGVRLGERGREIVTQDGSKSCSKWLGDAAVPPLALNQALTASIVPVDAQGGVLLGDLELSFAGSLLAHQEHPGAPFNRYVLEPTAAGTNTLTVTDLTLQQVSELSLAAEQAPAVCAPNE